MDKFSGIKNHARTVWDSMSSTCSTSDNELLDESLVIRSLVDGDGGGGDDQVVISLSPRIPPYSPSISIGGIELEDSALLFSPMNVQPNQSLWDGESVSTLVVGNQSENPQFSRFVPQPAPEESDSATLFVESNTPIRVRTQVLHQRMQTVMGVVLILLGCSLIFFCLGESDRVRKQGTVYQCSESTNLPSVESQDPSLVRTNLTTPESLEELNLNSSHTETSQTQSEAINLVPPSSSSLSALNESVGESVALPSSPTPPPPPPPPLPLSTTPTDSAEESSEPLPTTLHPPLPPPLPRPFAKQSESEADDSAKNPSHLAGNDLIPGKDASPPPSESSDAVVKGRVPVLFPKPSDFPVLKKTIYSSALYQEQTNDTPSNRIDQAELLNSIQNMFARRKQGVKKNNKNGNVSFLSQSSQSFSYAYIPSKRTPAQREGMGQVEPVFLTPAQSVMKQLQLMRISDKSTRRGVLVQAYNNFFNSPSTNWSQATFIFPIHPSILYQRWSKRSSLNVLEGMSIELIPHEIRVALRAQEVPEQRWAFVADVATTPNVRYFVLCLNAPGTTVALCDRAALYANLFQDWIRTTPEKHLLLFCIPTAEDMDLRTFLVDLIRGLLLLERKHRSTVLTSMWLQVNAEKEKQVHQLIRELFSQSQNAGKQ